MSLVSFWRGATVLSASRWGITWWQSFLSWNTHFLETIHPSVSLAFVQSIHVNTIFCFFLPPSDFIQLLGSELVDHVTLFPTWWKGGWEEQSRLIFSSFTSCCWLSATQGSQPLSHLGDWIGPPPIAHLDWEPRGSNSVRCTYDFSPDTPDCSCTVAGHAKRLQRWLPLWQTHWDGYFHAPSIWCSIFMFSDELTAQRKLLAISRSVVLCPQDRLCCAWFKSLRPKSKPIG